MEKEYVIVELFEVYRLAREMAEKASALSDLSNKPCGLYADQYRQAEREWQMADDALLTYLNEQEVVRTENAE